MTSENYEDSTTTPLVEDTGIEQVEPQDVISEAARQTDTIDKQIISDIELARKLPLSESDVTEAIDEMQTLREAVTQEQAGLAVKLERLSQPYVISDELSRILKTARLLNKPLLIEGEPGTGKTSLAYALAGHEDLPIIHAQCKSTSTAEDLLYQFDVVKRLQDAQLGKDVSDLRQYVQLGPLGRAFSSDEQVVLLIDEVDKARREFTNDLLHELDKSSFFINETGEEVSAKNKPIVIITSNHERELPEPVLRRVVYGYVEFPNQEQMAEIVRAHIPNVSDSLLSSAMKRFYEIRDTQGIQKKPSTAEILDWLRVLKNIGISNIDSKKELPALEAIIKNRSDMDLLTKEERKAESDERPKTGDKELVEAALRGDTVLEIDTRYGRLSGVLAAILANSGINFQLVNPNDSRDNESTEFPIINHYGIYFANRTTLAISKELPEHDILYQQLVETGLAATELREVAKTKFVSVKSSDGEIIVGEDAENHTLFKLKDDRFYAFLNTVDSKSKPAEIDPIADWEQDLLDREGASDVRDT